MQMNDMQLDMFEVQLGAALLLQFRTSDKQVVRVLADAGIAASGYSIEHVHNKLPGAFGAFGDETKRLDLIVGTHYDADHLEGLVPIIQDTTIDIGEAWMPPVANDTDPHALDDSVQDHHLLGYQFTQEGGEHVLFGYLDKKKRLCDELRSLENGADEFRVSNELSANINREKVRFVYQEERNIQESQKGVDGYIDYFRKHIEDTNCTLGLKDHSHADDEFHDGIENIVVDSAGRSGVGFPRFDGHPQGGKGERQKYFSSRWRYDSQLADSDARSMAFIRQSTAKDAINAASLYKVVTALTKRKIPILWRMIQDGQPRRFVWVASNRRFQPSSQQTSTGPEIQLFGPSEGLVKQHWNRLPIGRYMTYLARAEIPIKAITPSNQLSYVMRFGFKEQGILVTGDAGFVDSKNASTKKYYPHIVNSLLPLHVIQVAHHGGNNAHFYRVLLAAGYPAENYPSLLLLSHATHDKYRPSKEFGMFVERVRKDGDDVKLLFTSEPDTAKVHDYKGIIHPLVGRKSSVGDVQIICDNQNWRVTKHAVQV
jgi:hypothetical protein